MRKVCIAACVAVLAAIDQLLKWWAQSALSAGRVVTFGGVFVLRYVRNTGAAFSLLSAHTALLSVFSAVMILACLGFLLFGKQRGKLLQCALTMVCAGGVGNLIDRIRLGYVTDYIEPLFVDFAVFNFADILVTVGAFLLVLWLVLDSRKGKRMQPDASEGDAAQ